MEKGLEQAQAGSRRMSGGREPVAGWVTGPGETGGGAWGGRRRVPGPPPT